MIDRLIDELFDSNVDNMFLKLFGDYADEDGELYKEVYNYELNELRDSFKSFTNQYIIHNFQITTESIIAWILSEFAATLGKVDPKGCYELAYEIHKQINEGVVYN
ncbi:hypothetical protein KQI61_06045 [Anaerocolumna aminovalerica]|uniref:hypothetical protein n=1 Tax=Anaerocolumna aminovalerica TaxID=1527 RepID=UPI001C0EF826|nr:hypothetical protein [Anaerocolumna aminovalerica]MBU5331752.1 hypothetical protein [Anaerocolumna aminovalerica]